jgi:hypothetical protein
MARKKEPDPGASELRKAIYFGLVDRTFQSSSIGEEQWDSLHFENLSWRRF